MHRRLFLAGSAAAFAAAGLPFRVLAEGPGKNVISEQSLGPYLQGQMTAEVFERHVGSFFYANLEGGRTATLTLDKTGSLDELRSSGPAANEKAAPVRGALQRSGPSAVGAASGSVPVTGFYLTFRIRGALTEQGTYLLDHARLGHMAVFLVPGSQATCTAIFTTAAAG